MKNFLSHIHAEYNMGSKHDELEITLCATRCLDTIDLQQIL